MTFALSRPRAASTRSRSPRTIKLYVDVWRQRRELARLSRTMLMDLGIHPDDAAKEVARPIWDLPR